MLAFPTKLKFLLEYHEFNHPTVQRSVLVKYLLTTDTNLEPTAVSANKTSSTLNKIPQMENQNMKIEK